MRDEMDWGYASGVVAVLETFLLEPDAIADLAREAGSAEDVLGRARRSPVYADVAAGEAEDPMGAAEVLEAALVGYVRDFVTCCPTAAVADVFLIEHDLRDLANRLKAEHCGADRRPVELSRLPEDEIGDWLADRPRLAEIAAELAERGEAGEPIPADRVDRMLDGAFIAMRPELTAPLGSPLVDRWARRSQEHVALVAVLRARHAGVDPADVRETLLDGVPGGDALAELAGAEGEELARALAERLPADAAEQFDPSAGAVSIQALEDRLDAELAWTLAPARYRPFGPERVFAYLWRLFRENRNLRAALGGLAGAIEPDLVRAALRGAHG
ncbi:MAG: V-type ATPase subunit [Planctomycetota bacterium]